MMQGLFCAYLIGMETALEVHGLTQDISTLQLGNDCSDFTKHYIPRL